MKMVYKSTIYCAHCYKLAELNQPENFTAYTVTIAEDGSRKKLLKSPMFICDDCKVIIDKCRTTN